MKEHVGFLVSRSLTLPAAQSEVPQALFDDFPYAQKKNACQSIIIIIDEIEVSSKTLKKKITELIH